MTTFTAILFFLAFVASVSVLVERRRQSHGLPWLGRLAHRLPFGLENEGDRDIARTLADLEAAAQRDPR